MSVNRKIEDALRSIIQNIWPLCCPEESKPEEYIVYNPEMEVPGVFADDTDLDWVHYMQIHFYTKQDYTERRKMIRKRLRNAGFVVTDIDTFYESDTAYYHLCFSCYVEEE